MSENMTAKTNSFSSANSALPVKLLRNEHFTNMLQRGFVSPIHLQWIPINKCNANCSFCSCAGRDKSLRLDFGRSQDAIEVFASLGTKAVTITGGGEPTLYPEFCELVDAFHKNGIETGLVTNGLSNVWGEYSDTLKKMRWIRMSISDEYSMTKLESILSYTHDDLRCVDFALSYVVTQKPNAKKIRRSLELANEYELTHIRYVHDIVRCGDLMPNYAAIFENTDSSRAIIQPRSMHEHGSAFCGISLAKPVIYADGNIYPCCGAQYANAKAERVSDMPKDFSMGAIEDAERIWKTQSAFNGNVCTKCYYGGYNRLIQSTTQFVKHINFI